MAIDLPFYFHGWGCGGQLINESVYCGNGKEGKIKFLQAKFPKTHL
jgi:hypothetical protein